MTDQYKPIRDRGVYRAARNPNNPNYKWAERLVNLKQTNTLNGVFAWCYRDKGNRRIVDGLIPPVFFLRSKK